MSKCGCNNGGDCTKTSVCQCEYTSDALYEALQALVAQVEPSADCNEAYDDAVDILEEFKR